MLEITAYRQLRFAGFKRDGTACVGVHTGSPAELAELLYDRGYRSVRIEDHHGREVGGIRPSLDFPHQRTWWAES